MTSQSFVNIGSDNDLLPEGPMPLSDSVLTNHRKGLLASTARNVRRIADVYTWYEFDIYWFKITIASTRGQ